MSRGDRGFLAFKETDIARAWRAAQRAGIPVSRIDIIPSTRTISLVMGGSEAPKTSAKDAPAKLT